MMLRHLMWDKAADFVIQGVKQAISAQQVTYDFTRYLPGVKTLSCSEYGQAIIKHIEEE